MRCGRGIPALTDAAGRPGAHDPGVFRRFLAYGFVGWALEVGFTGMTAAGRLRDRRLRGHSYLWMLPIYGAGGLLLERLHDALAARKVPRAVRSLVYTLGIYGLEYGSASLLERVIGDVPWRYMNGLHVRGYVRLDYAPYWYACGWCFETLERELRKLDRQCRREWRPASGRDEDGAARPARPMPAPLATALP